MFSRGIKTSRSVLFGFHNREGDGEKKDGWGGDET